MNNIVNFFLPEPADPKIVQQIRWASKPMELLATMMLAFMSIFLLLGLSALFLYDGPLFRIDEGAVYIFFALDDVASKPETIAISELPFITRAGMFIIGILQYAPLLMVLAALRKLFARLRTERVFAQENATILTRMGIWLIVFAIIPAFTDLIAEATGGIDRAWFKYSSIGAVFLGGLLIVLARILEHGSYMEAEQRSIL